MATPQAGADYVVNPSAGFLNAEARRTLDQAVYSSNRVVTVQMPRDTVIKRKLLKLTAIFDCTYASGTPLFSELGLFARLVPQIEVVINGSRVVKSVSPYMLRMHNMIEGGDTPRRAFLQTGAATAPTVTRAEREWVAGTLAHPATTYYNLFNDAVEMFYELPWNYIGSSGYDTELDIRDVASADLKFYFANIQNVLQDGNAAPVTYANVTAFVDTQIIENRARPRPEPGAVLFDYVESSISRQISGQQQGYQIELQTGNYLAALGILCRNGDTNKSLADNILSNLLLRINGATAIQGPVDLADLQDDNVSRFGINDKLGASSFLGSSVPAVAASHPMKGFAFMNLLRNGSWNTAINTSRQAGVDTIKLEFNTAASSGTDAATYTNPVEVTTHVHEIRPFVYTR